MSEATGRIAARFSYARGQTILSHSYNQSPLKIAKTFPLEDGQIGVCLMDSSPGLLAGDHYKLDWHLEENSRVFLTNQSFTKVHPSRERPCLQRQHISVAKDAFLEYFPEPLMLYRDAAFRSECDISIAAGGTLLFSDILCVGRTARQETFQFHCYENRLRVRYDGELIFCNQVNLRPEECDPRVLGAWGGSTHSGNFIIFSHRVSSELRDLLREVMSEYCEVSSGVSLLHRHGVIVSMLGRRAWDLQEAMRHLREAAHDWL